MAQRLKTGSDAGGKKNFVPRQMPAIPNNYIPRGSPVRATPRRKLDHNVAPLAGRRPCNRLGVLPALQLREPPPAFVTQWEQYLFILLKCKLGRQTNYKLQ